MRLNLVWKLNSLLLRENKNIFGLRFLSIVLILGVSYLLYGIESIWPKSTEEDSTIYTLAFLIMNEVFWLKKTVTFGSFRHTLAWLSIPLSFREKFLLNIMQFFISYFLIAIISASVFFDGSTHDLLFYTIFFMICYSYPKNFRIIDQKSPELNKDKNAFIVFATSVLKFIVVYCYSFFVLILFVFTLQFIDDKAGFNYAGSVVLTFICLPLVYSLKTNNWLRISEHKKYLLAGRADFSLLKRQLMAFSVQVASIAILIVSVTFGAQIMKPKLSKLEQTKESDFVSLIDKRDIPAIKHKLTDQQASKLLVEKYIEALAQAGDTQFISKILADDLEPWRGKFLKVARKNNYNDLYLDLVVSSVQPLGRSQYDRGIHLAIKKCDEKSLLKIFGKSTAEVVSNLTLKTKVAQSLASAGDKNPECQKAISRVIASGSTENLL